MFWYDGTDIEIKTGDRVRWIYDDEIGELIDITQSHFSVKWSDYGVIRYPIDHIAAITLDEGEI